VVCVLGGGVSRQVLMRCCQPWKMLLSGMCAGNKPVVLLRGIPCMYCMCVQPQELPPAGVAAGVVLLLPVAI
jgi:hypothetical protein